MMNRLERLTTRYSASEDRVRISGEIANEPPVVLWLTRRLLDRLVSHLTGWLERQSAAHPGGNLLLSFAQEAAERGLTPQVAVGETAASVRWLVAEVDITPSGRQVTLVFRGSHGQAAGITFVPTTLRQWLGIVYRVYAMADWPLEVWPVWVGGQEASPERRSALH
jgi:hypothetical protein